MPLKFLRLPQLIQSEIMDNLLPEEIFLLSLCSQNSFKVLQSNFRKSTKLKITVDVSTSLCVGYKLNESSGQFIEFLKDLPNRDISADVKLIIDHISRLFWRNVHHVKLHGEPRTTSQRTSKERTTEMELHSFRGGSFNGNDGWLSFTRNIPHSFPISIKTGALGVEYFGNSSNRANPKSNDLFNADIVSTFLTDKPSSLQTPNSLQIDLDLSKMISWDTVDHLDTNVVIPADALKGVRKTIWLKEARFVTLYDLMNMNQVEIYLEKSKLTSADINSFLKSWMRNGENSLSKFLQCELSGRVDKKKIHEGLYVAEGEIQEYKSLRAKMRTSLRFLPDFESQRSDGATIAWKCDDHKITILFNPPKPGFIPPQTTRKGTYSIPYQYS